MKGLFTDCVCLRNSPCRWHMASLSYLARMGRGTVPGTWRGGNVWRGSLRVAVTFGGGTKQGASWRINSQPLLFSLLLYTVGLPHWLNPNKTRGQGSPLESSTEVSLQGQGGEWIWRSNQKRSRTVCSAVGVPTVLHLLTVTGPLGHPGYGFCSSLRPAAVVHITPSESPTDTSPSACPEWTHHTHRLYAVYSTCTFSYDLS